MPESAPKPGAHEPPPPSLSFAPIRDPGLSPRACQVLWALCYWAWGRKSECWPSNQQVADLIHCSPRTVQLALKELAGRGHVYRRMERTRAGWHRVITLAERYRPALAIVEPGQPPATAEPVRPLSEAGGGGATGCATPGASPCATPTKDLAPPLAQDLAHQRFEESEGGEKELAAIVGPEAGAPTPPAGEPEWLKVDGLNSVDLDHWRETRDTPGHPLRRVAAKILERWERHRAGREPEGRFTLGRTGEGPPGSPAKNTRGATIEGSDPSASDLTRDGRSGQDESRRMNIRPISGDQVLS